MTTTGLHIWVPCPTPLLQLVLTVWRWLLLKRVFLLWYDYYRENGLLVSPGGYPGEDLDTLTEFTYSRALLAGEYLRHQKDYQPISKS